MRVDDTVYWREGRLDGATNRYYWQQWRWQPDAAAFRFARRVGVHIKTCPETPHEPIFPLYRLERYDLRRQILVLRFFDERRKRVFRLVYRLAAKELLGSQQLNNWELDIKASLLLSHAANR